MSRFVSVCLCAVVACVSLLGAQLVDPASVLAATATVTVEAPLLESPDHSAPLVALLPEGTVVTIEGPPVDGFYPVNTGGITGWLVGETLAVTKDIPWEGDDADATPDASGEPVPAAQTAAEDVPLADPAQSTSPPPEAVPAEPPADAAVVEPVATDPSSGDPASSVPAVTDASTGEPAPIDPASGELPVVVTDQPGGHAAPDTDGAAAPVADPAFAATPVAAEAGESVTPVPEPTPDPNQTPVPTPEPGPTGLATTVIDMPIRTGPGQDYGLIFTVPQGSTVEQTGQLEDEFVSVQYKEVTGWSAQEHLGPFIEPTAETLAAESIDPKTPRPGSGVAFTAVDLSLRAGPSASEEPLTVIPAGSRVELTGVMENDFQRVKFRDQIGWIANAYLENPPNPEPTAERGGSSYRAFSEQQIVRIIYDAADRYDQSRQDMLRVARCESNLDPYAVNPSGSYGLFQFIRSTWKSTPFGGEDIFDPRANANAAGWMWSEGRKSEWVCQ